MKSTYEKITMCDDLPMRIIVVDSDYKRHIPQESNDIEHFIPPHWHRSLEMTYVKKGTVKLRLSEQQRTIEENNFLLVNSRDLHEMNNTHGSDLEAIILLISYDFLKEMYPNFDLVRFEITSTTDTYPELRHSFNEIARLSKRNKEYDYMQIISWLYSILHVLFSRHLSESNQKKKKQEPSKEILEYIHEHYQENVTLDEISSYFHQSKTHFSRRFKEMFGFTFMSYLINYRLYRAFPEIANTSSSIQELSDKHGFPNSKSLITHFKKRYSTTPGTYRKNQSIAIVDLNIDDTRQHL